MEVTEEVYRWLNDLGIVSGEIKRGTNGNIVVDNKSTVKFENGLNFTPVLKHLNQVQNDLDRAATPMPKINTLKKVTNTSSKLYNWNIISETMEMLHMKLDPDIKSLIVAGDTALVADVLSQIYQESHKYARSPSRASRRGKKPSQSSSKQARSDPESGIAVESIDPEKPLFEADSSIEFLIVSFCHSFSLVPKQAAGLLTQGNKFLAHIVAKGLKGDYEPVLYWFQDVYSNTERISDLIQEELEDGSLKTVLNAFKTGFISKNLEIVQWTCRVFSKMALEASEREYLPEVWQWFSNEQGALDLSLIAVQRLAPELYSVYVEMMMHISQSNLLELFTLKLRNKFSESGQYLSFMHEFLLVIAESESFIEDTASSGVLSYWIELGVKESDNEEGKSRALQFLVDIWILLFSQLEDNETIGNQILSALNKSCKQSNNATQQISTLALLFKLLFAFSEMKSQNAPIVYKTLTFMLVEYHSDVRVREFLLQNFKIVIETIKSIPVNILIEPLIKRWQVSEGSTYVYNTFDIEFIIAACNHPRVNIKLAVQIIDLLAKIYLNDIVFARAASIGFSTLASRFIDSDAMQEYLYMFTKIGCGLVIKLEQTVRKTNKPTDDEVIQLQKKIFILDMIYWIVSCENEDLNPRMKELLILANSEHKKLFKGRDCNGFLVILSLFGDSLMVIQSYEQENPEAFESKVDKHMRAHDTGQIRGSEDNDSKVRQQFAMVPYSGPSPTNKRASGFPWKRAKGDIEKAKMQRKMLDDKRREEEEKEAKRLELFKKKTAKRNEIRKIQQNVKTRSTENLILKEGVVEKQKEEVTIKEWELPAEQQEYDQVQMLIKSYVRIFKNLFQVYSGTGHSLNFKNMNDFDWLKERKRMLVSSEILKIFSDHKVVPKLIAKDKFFALLKMFCYQVSKTPDYNYLEYEYWVQFFVQVAIFIYNSSANNLSRYPPVIHVKALLDFMRQTLKEQKKSTEIYDDPEHGSGDKDVCKRLNRELAKNPETELPLGYMRWVERKLHVEYNPPVVLDQPSQDAYSILDDIVFNAMGFHIMNPEVSFVKLYRAKGVPPKKIEIEQPPMHQRPPSMLRKGPGKRTESEDHIKPDIYNTKISPTLKLLVAKTQLDDREIAQGVAEVLEDLIHSIELQMNRMIQRKPNQSNKEIVNKALEQREAEMRKEKIIAMRKEKVRQKRMEELKEVNAKAKEDRDKELAERKQQESQKKLKIAERKKKREVDKKAQSVEKAKQIAEWRDKVKADNAAAAITSPKKKELTAEEKKSINKRLKAQIKARENTWKNSKQESEEANKKLQAKMAMQKQRSEKTLAMARGQRDQAEKRKEQVIALEQLAKPVIAKHEKIIRAVFDFYRKMTMVVGDDNIQNSIVFVDLNKFNAFFNIHPGLCTVDQTNLIYRHLTMNQKETTINYENFTKYLIRLAAVSQNKLRDISARSLESVDEPTVEDVESLLSWLGFNVTPQEMTQRLNEQLEVKVTPDRPLKQEVKNAQEEGVALSMSMSQAPGSQINIDNVAENPGESDEQRLPTIESFAGK